jgi:hypothetical protein
VDTFTGSIVSLSLTNDEGALNDRVPPCVNRGPDRSNNVSQHVGRREKYQFRNDLFKMIISAGSAFVSGKKFTIRCSYGDMIATNLTRSRFYIECNDVNVAKSCRISGWFLSYMMSLLSVFSTSVEFTENFAKLFISD